VHGLFEGEVLVFLLFKGKLMKHANRQTRLGAVHATCAKISGMEDGLLRRRNKVCKQVSAPFFFFLGATLREVLESEDVGGKERREGSGWTLIELG
jgi:hypothetical protein